MNESKLVLKGKQAATCTPWKFDMEYTHFNIKVSQYLV